MSIQNINSIPFSPSVGASQKQKSPEEVLADFVGAVAGLQMKVAQFSIADRERELEMGKAEEVQQEDALQKQLAQIAAYEKAKEEAESEPAWKRALMGIATLGMSELAPQLEKGISEGLHAMGVHNGPLLKYLSKALTILVIVALTVVATAATGGVAGAEMAEVDADEAAGGAADAAEDGAAGAGESSRAAKVLQALKDSTTWKTAAFGLSNGIGSTNLGVSIAQDAGASKGWMIATLVLQTVGCIVLGGVGLGVGVGSEGAAFSGAMSASATANKALQIGRALQALAMLGAAGYSGYQTKKMFDASDDLHDLGSTDKSLTLLSSMVEQFNQSLTQSNAVVTAALKQSPNALAEHLADGYQVQQYLLQA